MRECVLGETRIGGVQTISKNETVRYSSDEIRHFFVLYNVLGHEQEIRRTVFGRRIPLYSQNPPWDWILQFRGIWNGCNVKDKRHFSQSILSEYYIGRIWFHSFAPTTESQTRAFQRVSATVSSCRKTENEATVFVRASSATEEAMLCLFE